MITLKKLIENFEEESVETNEFSGAMGTSPTTWDTPKGFSPIGSPVRTNEVDVPAKKLSKEEKEKLLRLVGNFNEYRKSMKMADELKNVAENIVYIAELTEKYGLNETSEWFEGVALEKDLSEIKKNAANLQKIANKIHPQIKMAESIYEEIGLRLEKFFEL